jgi:hypothetical protein
MERIATPLSRDLDRLMVEEERHWAEMKARLAGPVFAGETQNYHETRNPFKQTADYAAITITATSVSALPISTVLIGSSLQFPAGYWDLGKKVLFRVFGKITTAATPGNFTFEIRHQTGTPTDAGGTILATSGAIVFVASKTAASFFCDFTVEARAALGTAAGLFAKGWLFEDPGFGQVASTAMPIFLPSNAAVATNVDTTLASTISLQVKRSGSTAETIAIQDFQVNALT